MLRALALLTRDRAFPQVTFIGIVDSLAAMEPAGTIDSAAVGTLLASHREFVRYVEKRIGDRATAEEVVQDAFVRTLDRQGDPLESAVAWFYRVLRSALVDRQRREAALTRRHEAFGAELAGASEIDEDELDRVACSCVAQLATTLKPEYAEAPRRIDVEGVSVKDFAEAAGISASNAGVRIFRAREALRKQVARACGTCLEHGCLDCTCERSMHHHHR